MKTILYSCLLFVTFGVAAQENSSLSIGFESNAQYYMDDAKTGDFTLDNPFRANSYLKLDYTFQNFYAGVQVESYEPNALLNYSSNLDKTNLGLYFVGYKTATLDITAGSFYEQFGSGLLLRSWEDRQLGVNNALVGGRVQYSPTNDIRLTALYGKQRVGFQLSEGTVLGFNSDFELSPLFNLKNSTLATGFSYVGRKEKIAPTDLDYAPMTNAFSGRLDYSTGNLYTNIEYVHKDVDLITKRQEENAKKGGALQVNVGYAKKGLGIDATFRRMENMRFYSSRDAAGNAYNENTINYLPALTKQHDYLLTNIYVYQAQPQVSFQHEMLMKAGEIGGQLDVFFKVKKKTFLGGKYGAKIAINGSYWAGLKGDYDFENFEYATDFMGFGEKYYSDISFELRKKWSKKWQGIFYYLSQSYNKLYIEETIGAVNAQVAVSEVTYKMGRGKSLRFEAQHLWTKDDKKNWAGATVEFNLNSKLGFYLNDIYNYGNNSETKRIHYYNVGSSYTLGAHRFALNYGRQRGGLLCVGGVCRYVPESTGVSANILMSF